MHFHRLLVSLVAAWVVGAAPMPDVDVDAQLDKRATPASPSDFNELQRAARLASAAYSGCRGTAFDVTITMQLDDVETDTQGYVGYSTSLKRITVAMRGSTTAQDLLNDINTTLVTPHLRGVTFPTGTLLIAGVYTPWSSVHDDVIAEVRRLLALHPDYTLETTGHSLGGALTYLSYVALAQNFPDTPITSNALAPFPIGNAVFAAFGDGQKGVLRRGDNLGDGVPNMYPQFAHYGTEYYGAGTAGTTVKCSGQRDLQCSAGDGAVSVTAGHFSSFGVAQGLAGCG